MQTAREDGCSWGYSTRSLRRPGQAPACELDCHLAQEGHLGQREHPMGSGSLPLDLNHSLRQENLSMFDLSLYIYSIHHTQKVGKKFTKISSYS